MYRFLLLLAMVFLHIVDDYYLQGWLVSAKQKSWWEQNAPDKMYKNDYTMALFMHSFSWTFMIMIVPSIYTLITTSNIDIASFVIIPIFIINLYIHMITDDMKANMKKINLIQDQLTHLVQIAITWVILVVFGI